MAVPSPGAQSPTGSAREMELLKLSNFLISALLHLLSSGFTWP
jgi:hypothetical protein